MSCPNGNIWMISTVPVSATPDEYMPSEQQLQSAASAKQMREQAEGCQPGLLPIEPEKDKRCQDLQKGRGQN